MSRPPFTPVLLLQDINSLNKQIAQLQDLVRSRGTPSGRHIQTHSNTIVVSLQVFNKSSICYWFFDVFFNGGSVDNIIYTFNSTAVFFFFFYTVQVGVDVQ